MRNITNNISVDCVIFGFDFEKLNVLLVERILLDKTTNELLINDHTLTGYHVFDDEDLDTAAARILKSLSGLDQIYLQQFYTFSRRDRLSNAIDQLWLASLEQKFSNHTITVGYYSLIDNTKVTLQLKDKNVAWFPVAKVPQLAFDHKEILEKALETLQQHIKSEPIGFELLPEKFTLSQLQRLYESILGTTYDKRNFRKKVAQMKYLVPLEEKQEGVPHKRAQFFTFNKKLYLKSKKERFIFSI